MFFLDKILYFCKLITAGTVNVPKDDNQSSEESTTTTVKETEIHDDEEEVCIPHHLKKVDDLVLFKNLGEYGEIKPW